MSNLMLNELSTKNLLDSVPVGISEYLNKYFWGNFISDVKKEKDDDNQFFFKILISDRDTLYHLKFNLDGVIKEKQIDSIWDVCEYIPVDQKK
jgi:hypothetical protein